MQTVTVLTRKALKRAIQAGVGTIVVGGPLATQVLRVLRFKPAALAISSIIPPILFPPLAPLLIALAVFSLGAILYLAFLEDYEVVVEKDENNELRIVIRKRRVPTAQPQPESQDSPKPASAPASDATS